MTSQSRIAANIQNAKHSCGPKTAAGKRRSSMNALKHGMTARIALMPDESRGGVSGEDGRVVRGDEAAGYC